MTAPPEAPTREPTNRATGWAAIASGIVGIISFGFLLAFIAYAVTQKMGDIKEFAEIPLVGRLLLKGSYVGSMLQALCMIPVLIAVHALGRLRSQKMSGTATAVGMIGLIAVALLRAIILVNPKVSDILFIGPMGFVGAWLVMCNSLLRGVLSRGIRVTGMIVGVGFVIASLSFFFLGGVAEFTHPGALGNDLVFHAGLWGGGIPAFLLYPVWAILLGRKLVRARDDGTTPSV